MRRLDAGIALRDEDNSGLDGAGGSTDGRKHGARIKASLLLLLALTMTHQAQAQDRLKIAVGGRGIGETFITEVGDNAGLFRKQNLALDIFYTDGGGETQQAVISNSAQIGVASGFLGAIGVFAQARRSASSAAPIRRQPVSGSPGKLTNQAVQDLDGKTIAYSNSGSSTHAGALALQKHYKLNFQADADRHAAATMTAAMSGQVDAGWAGAPFGVAELEAGKTRLIMKSSEAPDFDKQTGRVIVANADELKARPDVFVRYNARLSRVTGLDLFDAGGAQGLCGVCELSEETARRALKEFLPLSAVDPIVFSGVDEVVADAIAFKFITAPLTAAQRAELIRVPQPK